MKKSIVICAFILSPIVLFAQLTSDKLFRTGYYYLNIDAGKAIDYLSQAIGRDSTRAKYFYFRGIAKYKQGDYAGSIADFNQVNKRDTLLSITYMYMGMAYKNVGDYEKASDNIDKYINKAKVDNSGYAHLMRGKARMAAGDMEGAINDFTFLTESFPENESNSYYRLVALQQMGENKAALEEVNKLLELNPDFYGYYFYRGNVNLGLGKFSDAITDYSTSIDYNDSNADAYFQRGVVLDTLKKFTEAISNYSIAISINASDGVYYSRRGNSRFTIGNKEGACLDWTIAGNLGYYENFEKVKRLCD